MRRGENHEEVVMRTAQISVEDLDGVRVLCLQGDLDMDIVEDLDRVLEGCLEAGTENVVVDLAKVRFASSTIVSLLVGYTSRFRKRGSRRGSLSSGRARSTARFPAASSAAGSRGEVFAAVRSRARGFRSRPAEGMPIRAASTSVVPLPANGSRTASPSGTTSASRASAIWGRYFAG